MTLPYITHDSLSTTHGFFGRQGGVSKGIYASLNAGPNSGDSQADIAKNRTLISEAMGAEDIVTLSQIHSDHVEIIETPPPSPLKADGLVTREKNIALSVLSADCGPILFHDMDNQIIGACHSGWKGAIGGIIESTIAAMCEIGASPTSIKAILGPCISQKNYEVGEIFKANFTEIDPDYDIFFESNDKGIAHFDLPRFILSRLKACDVALAEWTGECTYAEETSYFSYRRNTHQGIKDYGRNISVIILK